MYRTFLLIGLFSFQPGGWAQVCTPAPSGLIAWWPGDGDARDVVGGNHGAAIGGVTFSLGKVDKAFSFGGSSGEVELSGNSIIGAGGSPFTVTKWIRPTVAPTGSFYFPIRLKQDTEFLVAITRDYNLNLFVPGDYLVMAFRAEPQQWWVPLPLGSMLNTWSHLAFVFNGGGKSNPTSYAAFLNGVPLPTGVVDLGPVGGTCNGNALASHSASACAGGSVSFAGMIDEVQIFNRVLLQSEVQSIYNAGSAGLCKPEITVSIDIRPGAYPNTVNLGSNGVLTVAILSSSAFNATTVDPASVRLSSGPVRLRGNGTPAANAVDSNGDGLIDLQLQFEIDTLELTANDTEAVLTGKTYGGQAIRGVDTIRVVP